MSGDGVERHKTQASVPGALAREHGFTDLDGTRPQEQGRLRVES